MIKKIFILLGWVILLSMAYAILLNGIVTYSQTPDEKREASPLIQRYEEEFLTDFVLSVPVPTFGSTELSVTYY